MSKYKEESLICQMKSKKMPYKPRLIDVNTLFPGQKVKVWFGKEKRDPLMFTIEGKIKIDDTGNRYILKDTHEHLLTGNYSNIWLIQEL